MKSRQNNAFLREKIGERVQFVGILDKVRTNKVMLTHVYEEEKMEFVRDHIWLDREYFSNVARNSNVGRMVSFSGVLNEYHKKRKTFPGRQKATIKQIVNVCLTSN